jgi:integrase
MTKPAFPKTVEYRGCKATIYLQNPRRTARFEVRCYDAEGAQQRLTFATYEIAKEFAKAAVREIAQNRSNFITLRGVEASDYQQVVKLLAPTGLSLRDATTLVVDSLRLLEGSAGILDAVRYYADHRPRKSPDITVRQVVKELLDLKQREGAVGPLHLRDLRNRLGRFADKFDCPICKVSPQMIRDHILAQLVSERTRHNLRTTLAMLFNFAAAEGYLPADHKGVPRPTKRRRLKMAVRVFTPEEMTKLLNAARGGQIVALAICGFAGIRAEELKRLRWEHINFDERHIVVPDTVAKCEERRIVPMTENLRAWLLPLWRDSGPVCPFANLAIVFERTAKRAGIAWKRNGLRHSFISYRVALIKNVAQVAFEAGNSPVMVHRHYLKCVSETLAQRWFGLVPGDAAKLVPLPPTGTTEVPLIGQAA